MKTKRSLLGRWRVDPTDHDAIEEYGDVSLEFRDDGQLVYVIHAGEKAQLVYLNFRIEGGELVTNQPSAPNEERTSFDLRPDGRLILRFGRRESRYVRDETPDILAH
ncbi:MAG TPA: hypothetical protein PLB02_03005 [Thermoanaerobaculia bacterium]|nr:hypothetical protein [Thermoanaerobaculia bacterium]